MIDAERNDTEAHHDARMWSTGPRPIEITFGLAKTRWIPHLLNHGWLRHPINRSGWQHRKDFEEEDRRLGHGADRPRRTGEDRKHVWHPVINPGGRTFRWRWRRSHRRPPCSCVVDKFLSCCA